jgi:chemotaxis signal transduction protein/CheY-like chemotaxis protein
MIENQQIINNANERSIIILPFSLVNKEIELHMCLNVQKIAAVFEVGKYSVLPGVMPPFVYMIDMQGIPVPVLELSKLVENNDFTHSQVKSVDKKKQTKKRIIVCHILSIYIGIIVDFTKKIKTVQNANLQPIPEIWEQSNSFFVSGLLNEKDYYRYVFDIERYISNIGLNIGSVSGEFKENNHILRGKKGLVVKDSRVYQLLAKKFFEKYEMAIELAVDGKIGLDLLLKNADKYDFVITDIEMPNMNGIEMIKQFKSIHKNSSLPILFHSSISNPEFSKDLMVEGYGDMITKFNEETLYQSIINLFHKE